MDARRALAQLVERLAEDRRFSSVRLTGVTVLYPLAKHFIRYLKFSNKSGHRAAMTIIVDGT